MDTNKYPINWRDLPVYPEWASNQPRDIYQLDEEGNPWNTMWCAEDIAFLIWPDGENTQWAISPTWYPYGVEDVTWPPSNAPEAKYQEGADEI